MADARAALVQGDFRRALLEMAITCEVATKQLFSKLPHGTIRNVDLNVLRDWLDSLNALIAWIRSK
jgi:hypothetical protein